MATWLILALAALVLAVVGATTAATWLLAVAVVALVAGLLLGLAGRRRPRIEPPRAVGRGGDR